MVTVAQQSSGAHTGPALKALGRADQRGDAQTAAHQQIICRLSQIETMAQGPQQIYCHAWLQA